MPRQKTKGQKPILNYFVNFGYDKDVKKWFIDIELFSFPHTQNVLWFDLQKEYKKKLEEFLDYK